MTFLPDFEINSNGAISREFLNLNIIRFAHACNFIQNLSYNRNTNKNDLLTVFSDNCRTCSSKHALLKSLADENNFPDLKLMIGIFKMNANNMSPIAKTLAKYNLAFIPEAHCYLKYKNVVYDFTKLNSKPSDFLNDLLDEIEISPKQISDFKINYHKIFLNRWLQENHFIKLTINELWNIREECIIALSEPDFSKV